MLTIAVTGGAAAGKSTVCHYFKELGAHVLDLDQLAREAVRPSSSVFRSIVDRFGNEVVAPDGTLDRGKLRLIITTDHEARRALEALIHPEILRLFEERLAAIRRRREDAVVVAEVPLLIELGLQDRFDVVILVEADRSLQKKRLMARDGATAEESEALLAIQMEVGEKRAFADYIIGNRGGIEDVGASVREVYKKIGKGPEKS